MLGAALSGSNALLGFGLDSFVESLSAMVMIWRFWKFDPAAEAEEFEKIERRAARLVGYSFFVLGSYVILDAGYALYQQEAPETSLIGIGLAIASIIVMPVLFLLKFRLGKAIGSRSLVADSKETLAKTRGLSPDSSQRFLRHTLSHQSRVSKRLGSIRPDDRTFEKTRRFIFSA